MFFRKKKPKRLYLPAKKKWYTRQRPVTRKKLWVRGKKQVHLKRQFNLFKKQWFYWIVGALVLLGVFLALFFSTYLKIAQIQVVRQDLNVDSAAIQQLLKPYIGENILFFDKNLAIQKVKENFVEYAEVKVKKEFPNTLKIELKSQPLVFNLWAYYTLPKVEERQVDPELPPIENTNPESEEPLPPTEQKALLNAAGQVLLKEEENLELKTIVIQGLNRPMEDREVIFPPPLLTQLQAAIERFESLFPERIKSVTYFPQGREIHLQVDNGLSLWITFQKDTVAQVDKLYSIYQPAALDQENLSYIDLRVAEKVIYCPRGAACDKAR